MTIARRRLSAVERLALSMWREREMTFPPFVRRMTPDEFDMCEAWPLMLKAARAALRRPSPLTEGESD